MKENGINLMIVLNLFLLKYEDEDSLKRPECFVYII